MVEKKYKEYFAPEGCFVKRNSIKKLLIDVFMNHVFSHKSYQTCVQFITDHLKRDTKYSINLAEEIFQRLSSLTVKVRDQLFSLAHITTL